MLLTKLNKTTKIQSCEKQCCLKTLKKWLTFCEKEEIEGKKIVASFWFLFAIASSALLSRAACLEGN